MDLLTILHDLLFCGPVLPLWAPREQSHIFYTFLSLISSTSLILCSSQIVYFLSPKHAVAEPSPPPKKNYSHMYLYFLFYKNLFALSLLPRKSFLLPMFSFYALSETRSIPTFSTKGSQFRQSRLLSPEILEIHTYCSTTQSPNQ